jgi:hypothetical protein
VEVIMPLQVEPLKRVRLAVESRAAETEPPLSCFEVEFIYGIGSSGVSPFECLLAGRQAEETVSCRLTPSETDAFFDHLTTVFPPLFAGGPSIFLTIRIAAIESPPPREIVKAIAETLHRHSGSCDCGCGCT